MPYRNSDANDVECDTRSRSRIRLVAPALPVIALVSYVAFYTVPLWLPTVAIAYSLGYILDFFYPDDTLDGDTYQTVGRCLGGILGYLVGFIWIIANFAGDNGIDASWTNWWLVFA